VPKSIAVGGRANLNEAIVVDLLLLGMFAIQQTSRTPSSLLRHIPLRSFRAFAIRVASCRNARGTPC
jgi:hypothetical protein